MHDLVKKPSPVNIDGRRTARRLWRMSAADRALLAHEAEISCVSQLSRAQAAQMFRVSAGYVGTVAAASEAEREALKRGDITLSKLHNNKRSAEVTDREIGAFIDRAGLGRVWLEVDRRTAPTRSAAE